MRRRAFLGAIVGGLSTIPLLSACAPLTPPAPTAAPPAPAKPTPAPAKPAAAAQPTQPAQPAPATAATKPAPAAGQPKRGGSLTLAKTIDVLDFEPVAAWPLGNYPMYMQVYNVPVRLDRERNPQPELAESWELNGDGTQMKLSLVKGVQYHSGRELVAEDIAFWVEQAKDPKVASNLRAVSLGVTRVETPDTHTAILHFDQPNPLVFDMLDMLMIGDPREKEAGTLKSKGVGTGPFKVESWAPGDQVRLVRNEQYWRKDRPYLDEVILKVAPDPAALVVGVESGAFTIAAAPPPQDFVRIRNEGRLQAIAGLPGSITFDVLMNVKSPPFDNKKVRQAIGHAVNRERFVESVLFGVGGPQCIPFPPGTLAYDQARDAQGCRYDLEMARRLLGEAGFGGGFEAEIITASQLIPEGEKLAVMLQSDLKTLGINLKIKNIEQAQWIPAIVGGNYQLAAHNFGRGTKDPGFLMGATVVFRPNQNSTQFEDPEYARLVKEAGATIDKARRKELYARLTDIILDEAFVLTVAPRLRTWVAQPRMHDLGTNLDDLEMLEATWVE